MYLIACLFIMFNSFEFKLTDISDMQKDKSNKYTLKKLTKKHKDYQLVLRSITYESIGLVPEVLHMYAVDSREKSEEIKGSRLFAHGVKSDKIQNVLKSGYDRASWSSMCLEECLLCDQATCARYASACFVMEVEKSNNIYLKEKCTMKNKDLVNKNLAYMFLVASKERSVNKNDVTDSRGCFIKDGTLLPDLNFRMDFRPVVKTTPVYLLVVKCSDMDWGMTLNRK